MLSMTIIRVNMIGLPLPLVLLLINIQPLTYIISCTDCLFLLRRFSMIVSNENNNFVKSWQLAWRMRCVTRIFTNSMSPVRMRHCHLFIVRFRFRYKNATFSTILINISTFMLSQLIRHMHA